jgi:hypothetical protein
VSSSAWGVEDGGRGDGLGRDGGRGPAGGCWALTAQASIDCDDAARQRLQVAQVLGGLAGFVAMLLGLALCRARRILESGRVGGGSGAWQLGWEPASEQASEL